MPHEKADSPFRRRESRKSCGLSSILELHNWTRIPIPRLEAIESGEVEPTAGETLLMLVAKDMCVSALPDVDPPQPPAKPDPIKTWLLMRAWEDLLADAEAELGPLSVEDPLLARLRAAVEDR